MKHPGGRPRKITGHVARKIFLLAGYGLTDEGIGEVLGISRDTICEAKKEAEFSDNIKRAKDFSDLKVLNSLYMRATGYDYEEEQATKTGAVSLRKHAIPDVVACMYWLNNRRRGEWRARYPEEEAKDPNEDKRKGVLVQIFRDVKNKELVRIRDGGSQTDVLFGKEFADKVKTGPVQGQSADSRI